MTPPEEFRKVAWAFHDGKIPQPFDEQRRIQSCLSGLDIRTRFVARDYIGKLLEGSYSAEDLRKVWDSVGPEYTFPNPNHARVFLDLVFKELSKRRA